MTENQNPLLATYQPPHGTAPFHLIRTEHFEPAIQQGMEMHNQEIDAIIQQSEAPTFENTILALEKSGSLLNQATTIFGNLLSAETSDEMQAIAERVMPQLSAHSNNISLNEELFARIKSVYQHTDMDTLNYDFTYLLNPKV